LRRKKSDGRDNKSLPCESITGRFPLETMERRKMGTRSQQVPGEGWRQGKSISERSERGDEMLIERIKKFFNGVKIMNETKPASPVAKHEALLPCGIPNLGDAILQPGPAVRTAATVIPVPAVAAPEPMIVQPTPVPEESASAGVVGLDTDYDDISLPPRSPEMIRRLIDAGETVEQRARRMHSDIARFKHQRGLL
jgi:hypothetical protein